MSWYYTSDVISIFGPKRSFRHTVLKIKDHFLFINFLSIWQCKTMYTRQTQLQVKIMGDLGCQLENSAHISKLYIDFWLQFFNFQCFFYCQFSSFKIIFMLFNKLSRLLNLVVVCFKMVFDASIVVVSLQSLFKSQVS